MLTDITAAALIEFESKWWHLAGAKERAIRETFGVSATRYFQLLGLALDTEEAMRTDPITVRRLKSLRASARSWRRAS